MSSLAYTFNHYKCYCEKLKTLFWDRLRSTSQINVFYHQEKRQMSPILSVLYTVETTYAGIFPSWWINVTGYAQSPPREQAPMPGLYLLDTREELSLNHHSSPSFSLACRELEEGKKDGLPWKRMVYRRGAGTTALHGDRGPIFPFAQKRVASCTRLQRLGPGGTGSLGTAKPTTTTSRQGP